MSICSFHSCEWLKKTFFIRNSIWLLLWAGLYDFIDTFLNTYTSRMLLLMLLIIIIVVDLFSIYWFEFHMSTGDNTKIIVEQADEPYTPCPTPYPNEPAPFV